MMISLENMCLTKIIYNFDIYNSAYSTTKNATLKLHFEFLQRVYSLEIIDKLHEKFLLKAEYIDFLINKHLKILNSYWLKNCTWDSIKEKISEIGVGLEKVHFQNTEPWEEVISHLQNLKSITYHIFCNNNALSYIAKYCSNIETINIDFSEEVSNAGIIYLCCNENGEAPCPVLKELNLELTSVQKDGMEYLIKNLPSLEKTNYRELPNLLYSLHKNYINEINIIDKVKLYNITYLNLCYTFNLSTFNDILKVCVSVCSNLKSLHCNVTTEDHMNLISELSKIEDLNLYCRKESPLSINNFLKPKGSKLLYLKLYNFSVSVSTLTKICRQLISLYMYENIFVHNDDKFTPMHNLKNLYFDEFIMCNICINQPYIQCLLSSPNLKSLVFSFDESLHSDLANLHVKCCNNFEISPSNIIHNFIKDILMTCPSLEIVTLEGFEDCYSCDVKNELLLFADTLPNRPKLRYISIINDFMVDYLSDNFYNEFDDNFDNEDYVSDEDDYSI